ncbi:hypothetical protein [Lysobacter enzymogenes]|uniref:hypothetical protein n=1 Tax=Lysobacter enzymogenes TaxID=69 RepID=UPI00099CA4EE|nr:hypothetical protein [Lysobacter enzymogenes]UZW60192.1 hypothetical protein BV903_023435 [Lysobacter enzymogenes]
MSDPNPKVPKPSFADRIKGFAESFAKHSANEFDLSGTGQDLSHSAPEPPTAKPSFAFKPMAPQPVPVPTFSMPSFGASHHGSTHHGPTGRPAPLPPMSAPSSSSSGTGGIELDPLTAAAIMHDGYKDKSTRDLNGWTRVGDEELRALPQPLNPDDFHRHPSGMRADLYRKGDAYTLEFRGTQVAADWPHNISQATGYGSGQYDAAVELTEQVKASLPESLKFVVGHSKGGGQAYVSGQANGVESVIANPAWPHVATLEKYGVVMDASELRPKNTTLHVNGEPLTALQQLGATSLVQPHGPMIDFQPPPHVPRQSPLLRHYVEGMEPDMDMAKNIISGLDRMGYQTFIHGAKVLENACADQRAGELATLAKSQHMPQVDAIIKGEKGGGFLVCGDVRDSSAQRIHFAGAVPEGELARDTCKRINDALQANPAQTQGGAPQQAQTGPGFAR